MQYNQFNKLLVNKINILNYINKVLRKARYNLSKIILQGSRHKIINILLQIYKQLRFMRENITTQSRESINLNNFIENQVFQ
jgi:hypothetical protein